MLRLVLLIVICVSFRTGAQEAEPPGGYKFQPPRPPPLDSSGINDDDDDFEMGDEGSFPATGQQMAPPAGAPIMNVPTPQVDNHSTSGAYSRPADGKVRFQLVEGEFWEKGKKRERGRRAR